MKRFAVSMAAALALGLCTTPAAHAGLCSGGGDPVYDPGSGDPCNFYIALAMTGAEATVHGRYMGRTPTVRQPSYVEDTADDGLDAYLWGRFVTDGQAREHVVAKASGLGATTTVGWLPVNDADAFYLRVCVGPDTTNCSDWKG